MTDNEETLAYQNLGPDQILDAVESRGYACDGRLLALNSYENRVYQIGIEDADPIIAKFYRPARWPDASILEEHDFAWELASAEIPVVPPLRDAEGTTLHRYGPHRVALFPRRGGRALELDNAEHLLQMGRFLGRIHQLGQSQPFQHRPALTVQTFGVDAYEYVLTHGFIPTELETAYRSLAEDLLQRIGQCYQRAGEVQMRRVHGDCHSGNVLWTDDGAHIVDLDDSRTAPAMQDIWMLLSGDREDQTRGLHTLLEGYEQFCQFDPRELYLLEALRTLRLMHYYGWLAKRWGDPAFPRAFPWFNTQRCWEEHILHLREQAAEMDEQPLTMP